ncbi:MAG: hypothetical protein HRT45_19460, partial [Bdellovibrionales bacterium]|nr:hypothetical protein [Bdellovibrionales bacterium]
MGSVPIRSIAEEAKNEKVDEGGLLPQTHTAWGSPVHAANQANQETMDPKQFVEHLLNYVRSETEADVSPFYKVFLSGELSEEQVKTWIKQFYFDVRGFPVLMAQIVGDCP